MHLSRLVEDSGNHPSAVGNNAFARWAVPGHVAVSFMPGVVSVTERAAVDIHHSIGFSGIEMGMDGFSPEKGCAADGTVPVGVFLSECLIVFGERLFFEQGNDDQNEDNSQEKGDDELCNHNLILSAAPSVGKRMINRYYYTHG